MATTITENKNAPYYGYRGCKKVIPRVIRQTDTYGNMNMVINPIYEQLIFTDFSFSALGQTFNVCATGAEELSMKCNSCQGGSDGAGEVFEPYSIRLNLSSGLGYESYASLSDIYSESYVQYYKSTPDYVKYVIKISNKFFPPSEKPKSFYIEYIIKSDGVIQIKSTQTIKGSLLYIHEFITLTTLLDNVVFKGGVSYVLKITGNLSSPEATLYEGACVDYIEELPIMGLLSINSSPINYSEEHTDIQMQPIFRNLVYPEEVLTGENALRIKTPEGIGEMLLNTSPDKNIPHLGVGLRGSGLSITDLEGDIEEYLVRSSDRYSKDEPDLIYSNFYVNTYSTNRYWYEVPIEYLLTPVTGVTQIDLVFRNIGGESYLPNSTYKNIYLCYASAHGYGNSSANSSYWKNVRHTLKKAYLSGCVEIVTFKFSSPVTIAEFCVLPPPMEGKSRWCGIDAWCIHTKNNVITDYAQNGAVREIS